MKLQSFKRILIEDYPQEQREMVEKLGNSINIFAEDVLTAINKKLNISDNLNLTQKSLTVTVDSDGVPTRTTQLKTDLLTNCAGIQVVRAVNLDSSTNLATGTPFITYSENAGLITITNITNLVAGYSYRLTVILYPVN